MVNPQCYIPIFIQKMTGITPYMVQHAPTIEEILPSFLEFVGQGIYVAHNAICDMRFINYFSIKHGHGPVGNFFVCTHMLSTKLLSSAPSKSLSGLNEYLGYPVEDNHRAEEDSYLTLKLLDYLLMALERKNIKTVREAIQFQGDLESNLRLRSPLESVDESSAPEKPGVVILLDGLQKPILAVSASNLRNTFLEIKNIRQLSKRVQKIAISAMGARFEEHEHLFSALLAEKQYVRDFSLTAWESPKSSAFSTLYSINLILEPEANEIQVMVSDEIHPNSIKSFGPVNNLKDSNRFLNNLTAIMGRKESGKIYSFEKKDQAVLEKVICRQSLNLSENWRFFVDHLKRKKNILFSWSRYSRDLNVNNCLQNVHSLLETSGIVCCLRENQKSWDLYPVVFASLGEKITINEHWQKWFSKEDGKEFLKNFSVKAPKATVESRSKEQSYLSSHVLWFILRLTTGKQYRKIKQYAYIDAKQVAELVEGKNVFGDATPVAPVKK